MNGLNQDLLILGETIRNLRKEAGFSQEAFAFHADIDRGYMGGIERGERNVTVDILCRICRGLDIKMAELTAGLPSER